MDTRDFSIDTIEEIYDIIEELKKQGTFLDTVSDFWLRGEPDAVMLCTYAANGEMEEYYRKYADSMNLTKEKFQKGKITQDELISEICDLYHVEDYGSKINYSLAVKKYQPEKKAAIVSDIFSTVLYIVGEDGIDSEKIEEIRQSVSAKSYIEDETWDMAEKAFRGVVVGVNAAVTAEYYGNVGKVESGRKTIIKDGKISIDDIKANPSVFSGKSADEIAQTLTDAGYDVTIQKSARSKSGAQIIKINNPGGGKNIS